MPKRRALWRRARGWLWQLALLVAVYVGISGWQERRSLTEGQQSPSFALSTIDGGSVSSSELRGKRVLLHFWATWCGVCRMEFGSLNALAASLPDDALLVSVVVDADDPKALRRFVREHGIGYKVLLADRDTLQRFGVSAFPTNYYLDEQGRIRDVTVGMSTRWAMQLRLWLAD